MVYSGQLDIIVAAPLTELMLQNAKWQYADEYKKVDRKVWKVRDSDSEVAGYVRRVHDFYQVRDLSQNISFLKYIWIFRIIIYLSNKDLMMHKYASLNISLVLTGDCSRRRAHLTIRPTRTQLRYDWQVHYGTPILKDKFPISFLLEPLLTY